MKVKVLSDFCHNIGTQVSLDKHCKKYPTTLKITPLRNRFVKHIQWALTHHSLSVGAVGHPDGQLVTFAAHIYHCPIHLNKQFMSIKVNHKKSK